MVLFCHIIDRRDVEDLQRLKDFVDSMTFTARHSEPVKRFHHLCELFCRIADLHVTARQPQSLRSTTDLAASWSEMDDYLADLGFNPRGESSIDLGDEVLNNLASASTNELGSFDALHTWFEGTQYMSELLDHDASFL